METDIILEGFIQVERVHGIRYTTIIGDGDSSAYPSLIQNVPGWGHCIQKLECANHSCKCYRGALEKLAQENPAYKGTGGLTEKMRRRLVSAARCAIKMRSKEVDRKTAVHLLRKDLLNGPNHCFGSHERFNPDFCSTAKDRLQSLSSTSSATISTHINEPSYFDEDENFQTMSATAVSVDSLQKPMMTI